MKIKKVLIANRAEIAVRVVKTCDLLGIESVTIYTDEDKDLIHPSIATESYALGSGTLAETYLNQEKIIQIAKDCGADAIHPGYGFLSENASFCEKVKAAGLIFIGPSVEAINLMGDKKRSKQRMEELGIPLVPGYHGDEQAPKFLEDEAKKIGLPVLIKASAGGGGKGMRIVNPGENFQEALEQAKREAKNAFGDDRVLIEKYITSPRHIEVQVMSDSHGRHLHFFERECSIQRRYQKIIEETPSVALSDTVRANICRTAVEIAEGINYLGAGTVEFILDTDDSFYFLEMNTRLQVEHPVTEMVTGVDLVEMQIMAAAGEKFQIMQPEIHQNGHAIECRIYAEDPDNDFLPTNGKVHVVGHAAMPEVRLDTGIRDENVISVNYDPMLGKIIVHAKDRAEAIEKMQKALDQIVYAGVKTNRDYLKRILNHPKFCSGHFDTHFVQVVSKDLKKKDLEQREVAQLIAALLVDERAKDDSFYKGTSTWSELSGFRNV